MRLLTAREPELPASFRIPMRGYEAARTDPAGSFAVNALFRIPMRGYEAQIEHAQLRHPTRRFRIPMRGYETLAVPSSATGTNVPNPHEGL